MSSTDLAYGATLRPRSYPVSGTNLADGATRMRIAIPRSTTTLSCSTHGRVRWYQDLRGNDAASEEKPKAEPSEPQHNEPAVAPVTAPSAEIGDNGALHSPAPSSVAQ
eukprot:109101-Rhodomonas_salina.1